MSLKQLSSVKLCPNCGSQIQITYMNPINICPNCECPIIG